MRKLDQLRLEDKTETQLLMQQFLDSRIVGLNNQVETKEDPPTLSEVLGFLEAHFDAGMNSNQFATFKKMFKSYMSGGYFSEANGKLSNAEHREGMLNNEALMSYIAEYIIRGIKNHAERYQDFQQKFIDAKIELSPGANTPAQGSDELYPPRKPKPLDIYYDENGVELTGKDHTVEFNKLMAEYTEFVLSYPEKDYRNTVARLRKSPMYIQMDISNATEQLIGKEESPDTMKGESLMDRLDQMMQLVGKTSFLGNSYLGRAGQDAGLFEDSGFFEALDDIQLSGSEKTLKNIITESMEYALFDALITDNNKLYQARKTGIEALIKKYRLSGISISKIDRDIKKKIRLLTVDSGDGVGDLNTLFFQEELITTELTTVLEAADEGLTVRDLSVSEDDGSVLVSLNQEKSTIFTYMTREKRLDVIYKGIYGKKLFSGIEGITDGTQQVLSSIVANTLVNKYTPGGTVDGVIALETGTKIDDVISMSEESRATHMSKKQAVLDERNKEIEKENKQIIKDGGTPKPLLFSHDIQFEGARKEYLMEVAAGGTITHTQRLKMSEEQVTVVREQVGRILYDKLQSNKEFAQAMNTELTISVVNGTMNIGFDQNNHDYLSKLNYDELYTVFSKVVEENNVFEGQILGEASKKVLLSKIASNIASDYDQGIKNNSLLSGISMSTNPITLFFQKEDYKIYLQKKQEFLDKINRNVVSGDVEDEELDLRVKLVDIEYNEDRKKYLTKVVAEKIQQHTKHLDMSKDQIASIADELGQKLHNELNEGE